MVAYTGKSNAGAMSPHPSFIGPVVIRDKFFGYHNTSIGQINHPGAVAAANVTLNNQGVPSVAMTAGGTGYSQSTIRKFYACVFSGGTCTRQAVGDPVITGSAITGVNIVDPGDYVPGTSPPSISFVTVGGPNIPAAPETGFSAFRTHDYAGNGPLPANCWNRVDPGDGSGNYIWDWLDQMIVYQAALGRYILFGVHGTPQAYASDTTYIGNSFTGTPGSSSPLNALGKTFGAPNVGLWGYVTAVVQRYNINAHLLVNPLTGQNFAQGTRLIHALGAWNEPQVGVGGVPITPSNGKYWLGSASDLVDIIRIVNLAAKAVDPLIEIFGCDFVTGSETALLQTTNSTIFNVLGAVDSIEGRRGYDWIDVLSVHPYDSLELGTHFKRSFSRYIERDITTLRATMMSFGSIKPISASEWGFYFDTSVFRQNSTKLLQAIQIKRCFAEHALLGLHSSFLYSWESVFSGNSCANSYCYSELAKMARVICGKTITAVNVKIDGAIQLLFSDGSSYFTG